jgi:protein CpxP
MAQQAQPNQTQPTVPRGAENRHGRNFGYERLSRELNLTADQKEQVRSIFMNARSHREALAPKLREEREALKAAVKSGNDREIDRIVQQNAQVNAEAEALHVKTMARVYAILTPDQKTKFDQLTSQRFARAHNGRAGAKGARSAS